MYIERIFTQVHGGPGHNQIKSNLTYTIYMPGSNMQELEAATQLTWAHEHERILKRSALKKRKTSKILF